MVRSAGIDHLQPVAERLGGRFVAGGHAQMDVVEGDEHRVPPSYARTVAAVAHLYQACIQSGQHPHTGRSPMTVEASTPIELVEQVYATLPERVATGRHRRGR